MATLYLLPENTPTQMMGIIIRSSSGKIAVIDGGMPGDAQGLLAHLREITGETVPHVDLWFLTHCHLDHIGALFEISRTCPDAVSIGALVHKLLSRAFVDTRAPKPDPDLEVSREMADTILASLPRVPVITPEIGQTLTVDDCAFHLLSVPDESILTDCANNSSLLIRLDAGHTRVMITGDLGALASEQNVDRYQGTDALRAELCQMAHHGQNGATRRFYEAVGMHTCLWPTPLWLWNNDAGQGYNTHVWKTVEVRGWMEELGVQTHVLSHKGLAALPL